MRKSRTSFGVLRVFVVNTRASNDGVEQELTITTAGAEDAQTVNRLL